MGGIVSLDTCITSVSFCKYISRLVGKDMAVARREWLSRYESNWQYGPLAFRSCATSSLVVKVGTKVKNIRLVTGDHDIDCKIEGIGAMKLKSQFVKKI